MVCLTPSFGATCRAAVELFGTPIVFQDGPITKDRAYHGRSLSSSADELARKSLSRGQACSTFGLFVAASACCPPRAGRSRGTYTRAPVCFQAAVTRSKLKRRRRGTGDDDAGDEDVWDCLWSGGSGFGGDDGGSGPSGWDSCAGGDEFRRALFEHMWVWQEVCAASMLRSWYFLIFPEHSMVQVETASATGYLVPTH